MTLENSLSLWSDGAAKTAIKHFVLSTTMGSGANYVPPEERIAVFDNDGTLWTEQPMYTQLRFGWDRVRDTASDHPEWLDDPVLKAAIDGDLAALAPFGMQGVAKIAAASHTGISTEALADAVRKWIATARHPRFDQLYTDLIFLPQLQLMDFLRIHGYQVYIVSGGGIEFMRPWAEEVYGVPPHQVIGSSVKTAFELQDGRGVLMQLPEIHLMDDGPGKPVGINQFIGRRPTIAVGNSDGDLEMMQYTTTGDGPSMAILIHHDDAEREYAYDRGSIFGGLDRGLDEAKLRGWTVVSMRKDWKQVFAHEA